MKDKLTRGFFKVCEKIAVKKPDILVASGLLLLVGGTVIAVIETKKSTPAIEKCKTNMDEIQKLLDNPAEDYDKKDAIKDKLSCVVECTWSLTKVYAPVIGCDIAGVALVLCGYGTVKKQKLIFAAALKAMSDAYAGYRERVKSELGEDREQDIYLGLEPGEFELEEPDKNGNLVKKKTKGKVSKFPGYSPFARLFDPVNSNQYQNAPGYNKWFIEQQEEFATNYMRGHGHVYLNQCYEWLGLEHTDLGAIYGWKYDPNDPGKRVDFGLNDIWLEGVNSFKYGYERSIILNFHPDPEPLRIGD